MSLLPEEVFKLYVSIKLHFTKEKYNVVKSGFKISFNTLEAVQKRNDYLLFKSVGKKFETPAQVASFFVANFAADNDYPLGDLDKSFQNYIDWQKRRQSLGKIFRDDVEYILNTPQMMNETNDTYKKIIGTATDKEDDQLCAPLFTMYLNKHIHIETVAILDEFDNFIELWENKYTMFRKNFLTIKKVKSFIKFDRQNFEKAYALLNPKAEFC